MWPRVRDETLTGLLAELLLDSPLSAVGEVRIRRKTPEVLLDLNGIRLILEGKAAGHRDDLYANALRRIDNGLCDVVVMVEYVTLGSEGSTPLPVDHKMIKHALKNGVFHVRVITYRDRVRLGRWLPRRRKTPTFYEHVDFHHIVAYVLTTYEALVKEANRDKVVGYIGLFAASHSLI